MKRAVDKAQFGRRVAARRAELNLTQGELADVVGMKQQGIDAIEKGKVERPRLMRELAAALDASEDWLLYNESLPHPESESPINPERAAMGGASDLEAEQLFRRLPADMRRLALEFLEFLAQRSEGSR